MKKKVLLILIGVTLLLIAACGQTEQAVQPPPATPAPPAAPPAAGQPEDPAPPEEEDDGLYLADMPGAQPFDPTLNPEIVHVTYWIGRTLPASDAQAQVQEVINEITRAALNIEVDISWFDNATFREVTAPRIAAGEDIDLMLTTTAGAAHFAQLLNNRMLLPICDLLDNFAPDIMEAMPPVRWDAMRGPSGLVYGMPLFSNRATTMGLMVVREWFEELGWQPEDVQTMDDVINLLRDFNALYPDKLAISGDHRSLNFTHPAGHGIMTGRYFDALGDPTGVAAVVEFYPDGTSDFRVVNRYTTEEFTLMRRALQTMYNEGLVDRDTAIAPVRGNPLAVNERVFAQVHVTDPFGLQNQIVAKIHEPLWLPLKEGVYSTHSATQFSWVIPITSAVPEHATKLLNMMFVNEDLVNTWINGIEGVHHIVAPNGQFDFPPGVNAQNAVYWPGGERSWPNTTLPNTWVGQNPDLPAQERELIHTSLNSPLLGFSITPTDAIRDIQGMIGVIARDEFGPFIFTGAASDELFDEFIDRLYGAGMQTFLDEVQRQLDEWLANR